MLGAPLDVLLVRKLGVPSQPELAMGAVGEDGAEVVNAAAVRQAGVTAAELAETVRVQRAELDARRRRLRGERAPLAIAGRTVIVVDDGIATGATVRVACRVARARGARRVVLAVPVAPRGAPAELLDVADDVICLDTPTAFHAVGQFYDDFRQVSDAEVTALLARTERRPQPSARLRKCAIRARVANSAISTAPTTTIARFTSTAGSQLTWPSLIT